MIDRVPFRSISVVAVAGTVWLACIAVVGVAGTDLTGDPSAVETAQVGDPPPVLQGESGATHLVAAAGIAALVVLGGTLAIRNRLRDRSDSTETGDRIDDERFVTDREKVRRLVEENGGRMKQAEIVDSVEWSKAKVSRLLADLESDDEITKLRLGRENLICLDGHEPTASQSSDRSEGE